MAHRPAAQHNEEEEAMIAEAMRRSLDNATTNAEKAMMSRALRLSLGPTVAPKPKSKHHVPSSAPQFVPSAANVNRQHHSHSGTNESSRHATFSSKKEIIDQIEKFKKDLQELKDDKTNLSLDQVLELNETFLAFIRLQKEYKLNIITEHQEQSLKIYLEKQINTKLASGGYLSKKQSKNKSKKNKSNKHKSHKSKSRKTKKH
jgi:hypothetical protein